MTENVGDFEVQLISCLHAILLKAIKTMSDSMQISSPLAPCPPCGAIMILLRLMCISWVMQSACRKACRPFVTAFDKKSVYHNWLCNKSLNGLYRSYKLLFQRYLSEEVTQNEILGDIFLFWKHDLAQTSGNTFLGQKDKLQDVSSAERRFWSIAKSTWISTYPQSCFFTLDSMNIRYFTSDLLLKNEIFVKLKLQILLWLMCASWVMQSSWRKAWRLSYALTAMATSNPQDLARDFFEANHNPALGR